MAKPICKGSLFLVFRSLEWSWLYDNENPPLLMMVSVLNQTPGKNYYNGDLWTSEKPSLPGVPCLIGGVKSGFNNKGSSRWIIITTSELALFNPDYFHKTCWKLMMKPPKTQLFMKICRIQLPRTPRFNSIWFDTYYIKMALMLYRYGQAYQSLDV